HPRRRVGRYARRRTDGGQERRHRRDLAGARPADARQGRHALRALRPRHAGARRPRRPRRRHLLARRRRLQAPAIAPRARLRPTPSTARPPTITASARPAPPRPRATPARYDPPTGRGHAFARRLPSGPSTLVDPTATPPRQAPRGPR